MWYVKVYFYRYIGFFLCLVFSQEVVENDSLLLWQADRPLKWEDFKGPKRPVRIHNAAGTAMTIIFNTSINAKGQSVINPLCYFEKYRSWTATNDTKVLTHEQVHFDIGELYVRKLRKIFKELSPNDIREIERYFEEKQKLDKEHDECQKQYDSEVLLNDEKQQEWQSRIAKELEDLKAYEYVPEE